MRSKKIWKSFENTGSVYDYLMYKKIQKRECEIAEDMNIEKKKDSGGGH